MDPPNPPFGPKYQYCARHDLWLYKSCECCGPDQIPDFAGKVPNEPRPRFESGGARHEIVPQEWLETGVRILAGLFLKTFVSRLDYYAILLVPLRSAGQGFKPEGTYLDLTS